MLCRVCNKKNFSLILDLNLQPWGNHFLKKEELGKEPFYPLKLIYCHDCQTVQLDFTVKKEVMFSNHTYLSGITNSLKEHFKTVAQNVDLQFFKDQKEKSVLDIGSNDGSQLKFYQDLGYDVLGVESSATTAKIANDAKIPTLHAFFNLDIAQKIGKTFDVINASGVFFHLEELHSVTEAIKYFLKKEGVFVVQFLYMKSILQNTAFDQIYHEHLLYYTLQTINALLQQHGLSLFDAYLSPIHGGSIIGYVGHIGQRPPSSRLQKLIQEEQDSNCNSLTSYQEFALRVQSLKKQNLDFLDVCKKQHKTVFAMGAPVKGNTLLNFFSIGTDLIPYLVEKNSLRKGLYSPGMHIPIVLEQELKNPPDVYYVLAWNFKKEILKNNQHLIEKGVEFYFPVNPKE
jgi:SAM-dependent methyltransferase